MSFHDRILLGLAAGVALGLFLGEYADRPEWAADGVRQAAADDGAALRHALDRDEPRIADYAQARTLGVRAGAVLVALWVRGPRLRVPDAAGVPAHAESAMFFSTSLLERRPPFDFVDLYIPSNPFNSLANNIVPAVVLFSVVVGVALIGVERKQVLLDVLRRRGRGACRARTRFVVRLTPYGLFAIAASAAGTLQRRAARAAADLSGHATSRVGAAGQPLGPAGSGRRADADPGAARSSRRRATR